MKHPFYIAILLLLLPLLSPAQVQIGLKGGFPFYKFTHVSDGHSAEHYTISNNPTLFSLCVEERTNHVFNLAVELQSVNRKFSVNYSSGAMGGGSTVNYSFKLWQIYLIVKPEFVFGKKIRYYFYPGLFYGRLVGSSLKGTLSNWRMNDTLTHITNVDGTAMGYFRLNEFGFAPGTGIDIPLWKTLYFSFEAIFLVDMKTVDGGWGGAGSKMLNLYLQAGIAYTLKKNPSGKKDSGNTGK